jgi:hypothetical protein
LDIAADVFDAVDGFALSMVARYILLMETSNFFSPTTTASKHHH